MGSSRSLNNGLGRGKVDCETDSAWESWMRLCSYAGHMGVALSPVSVESKEFHRE